MSPSASSTSYLSMDVLVAELDAIGHRVDDGLPPEGRARLLGLRAPNGDPEAGVRAPMPDRALIMLALIDDCLRALHRALLADGRVDADELDHVFPLVFVAAGRYGRALARYAQFSAVDSDGAAEFLRLHRSDRRPLGFACERTEWLGLELCRATAAATGQAELLADYERMMLRLLDEVIAFDGVTAAEAELRRSFAAELARRLAVVADAGPKPSDGRDPRLVAFCKNAALDVFGSVAQPAHVHERDALDVGTIHAHARQVFEGLIARATTPTRQDRGRILLVRGEAGSGKTHLMRAFRAMVHGPRLGYCGYAALTSETGDYARYLLANLIDSLEKPYDRPSLERQSIGYLSDGLAELGDVLSPDELERLRNEDMEPERLTGFVGKLVDRFLRARDFADVDVDVLQALLLVQRGDPAVTKRVVRFLRCEDLNAHDRAHLGGLAPKLEPEAPLRMIVQLGKLMWAAQQAGLVILVDQIEDMNDLEATRDRYRRAVGAMRAISELLPSSVVVLACLDDLWQGLRERIPQSDRDRLEHDPLPVVLRAQRTYEEIEALVARRLENLYVAEGVAFQADEPIYPFRREQLEAFLNLRTRDVLQGCKAFHDSCIVRGEVSTAAMVTGNTSGSKGSSLDGLWTAFRSSGVEVPDEPDGLLDLLASTADALATELPLGAMLRAIREGEHLVVESSPVGEPPAALLVGLTDKGTQRGALSKQLEALSRAQKGRPAVAVRTSEFKASAGTATARSLAAFIGQKGRKLVIDNDAFRTMAAFAAFAQRPDVKPQLEPWQRAARPLSAIPALAELFELERLSVVPVPAAPVPAAPAAPAPPTPSAATPPAAPAAAPSAPSADRLRIGTTASLRGEPVDISLEQLKQHAVFLGSTGSGKTTIALNLIEQLVERGVPALLLDRKGDLCRYASPDWWDEVPADPAVARRKVALRERIDVRLFTPGETRGRNLILPLLPAGIASAHEQEREKIAKYCAASLATLMNYGQSEAHQKRAAVLKAAFEVHADASLTIGDLIEAISRPEGELLLRTDSLQKYFKQLVEDLQTLRISFGHLLTASGESLDVSSLLAPRAGRTALSIVSTKFLGERSSLMFWVARLLVELTRYLEQHPRPELQAVGFFDEADLYLPATSSPATKEPMMDLLRRARSKGFGVLLASQNPGDFDYKGRENINTWFVGRVAQERSIAKMRDLLGDYPNVSGLASQPRGQFFMLEARGPREVRADRNLCETRELTLEEILQLARTPG